MRTIYQLEEDGVANRSAFLERWRQYRDNALPTKVKPSPSVIPIKEFQMHQDARMSSRLAWLAIIPLCVLAAVISSVWLLLAAMADPKGKRAWELAEAFDRLGNAAI